MVNLIRKIKFIFLQKEVIKNLTIRYFKTRYVNSLLGVSWAIFIPLILMFVLNFVFQEVLRIEKENFHLFILSALLPFIFFSSSLTEATNSIPENIHFIRQFVIPKESIPISIVLTNFLNFSIGLIVLLPVFIFFNFRILFSFYCLPLILFIYLFFVIGIALFFSALNVFFRDLPHLLGIILMFLFWMTPIFYEKEMLPDNFQWITKFNPLSTYITLFREILLKGEIPEFWEVGSALGWAFLVFFGGFSFFNKTEQSFLKRL